MMPAQEVLIGAYRILQRIGSGGMGAVYLGEHTLLGRKAAIKVLRSSLSADTEIVTRFFNEARAVTLIADPGIVQVFDFGVHTDGRAFIVMELLEGEPMDRRLRRIERMDLLECLRFVRMMCSSLAAAHSKGIIHRDLKPANVFIVGDSAVPGGERVKILDFGIAKHAGDEPGKLKTRTGLLMGTPMYMSPEQCRGAGDIDHRSDIYALGCVMFTMLAGRPPFGSGAPGDLVAAHLREAPPLAALHVPGLPVVVDQILQRCLQKSPAERFQSMTELDEAIAAIEQPRTRPPEAQKDLAAALARAAAISFSQEVSGGEPAQHSARPAGDGMNAVNPGPTTLNGASGQSMTPNAIRNSRRRIAAVIAGAILIGCAGAIAMSRGNDRGAARTVTSAERRGDGSVLAKQMEPIVPDATPSPPVFDAGADDIEILGSAALDAGVRDASLVGEPTKVPDLLRRAKPNGKIRQRPDTKESHASSTAPVEGPGTDPRNIAPPAIDRGD